MRSFPAAQLRASSVSRRKLSHASRCSAQCTLWTAVLLCLAEPTVPQLGQGFRV